jgi:hypothetical protein
MLVLLVCTAAAFVPQPACRISAPAPAVSRAAAPLAAAANEWSRPVALGSLGKKALREELDATDAECAALAERFDLDAIESLRATAVLTVVDKRRMRVCVSGELFASVRARGDAAALPTSCPFETHFVRADEAFDQYSPGADDDEAYDEAVDDDTIDVGECVAQHLYVQLNGERLAADEADEQRYETDGLVFDSDPDLDDIVPAKGNGVVFNLDVAH